ncbi:uncharacterized protein BXZ73DRAFT_97788 [Epithele typhae]|uniref:uncharacterized protein n=1 Tax=Epithele typhae TaxID=378194 RepID=UPI002007E5B3|nr:uncharacterized protein BXZ73DRAFT_97788 [Epithele typhae]KAH9942374.1 hypothetical protein BXZ73DRAFT_97788 [Epithele typhae]
MFDGLVFFIRFIPQSDLKPVPTADDGRARRPLPTDNESIDTILSAQRLMPTWRAYVRDTTTWDETAEENTRKFLTTVGVEDSPAGLEQDV